MLGTIRKDKLLSIVTNDTKSMTSRVSGSVTGFEYDARPGFFCVWYAVHQLDLVVQRLMSKLLQENLRSLLNALIANHRVNNSPPQEMDIFAQPFEQHADFLWGERPIRLLDTEPEYDITWRSKKKI